MNREKALTTLLRDGFILIFNHQSILDPFLAQSHCPPTVQSMMDGPKHYLTYGQYAKHREKIIVNT